MKAITMYQASDLTPFDSEEDCVAYEASLQIKAEVGEYCDWIGLAKGNRTRIVNSVADFMEWKAKKEAGTLPEAPPEAPPEVAAGMAAKGKEPASKAPPAKKEAPTKK